MFIIGRLNNVKYVLVKKIDLKVLHGKAKDPEELISNNKNNTTELILPDFATYKTIVNQGLEL